MTRTFLSKLAFPSLIALICLWPNAAQAGGCEELRSGRLPALMTYKTALGHIEAAYPKPRDEFEKSVDYLARENAKAAAFQATFPEMAVQEDLKPRLFAYDADAEIMRVTPDDLGYPLPLRFPMPPETARATKERGDKMMLVHLLVPQLPAPSATASSYESHSFRPKCIALVDAQSREILGVANPR